MSGSVKNLHKAYGFSTLLLTVVVLISITLFAFVSADSVVRRVGVVKSQTDSRTAFNAAQAGIDYAVGYLTKNYATVTNNSSSQLSLSGGAYAVVSYAFVGSTKDLIRVTSRGYTQDGQVVRTLKQLVKYKAAAAADTIIQLPNAGFARNNLDMRDNAIVKDLEGGGITTKIGKTVSMFDNAKTILSSGVSSTSSSKKSDITTGFSDMLNLTTDALETAYLGQTLAQFQAITTAVQLPQNAAPNTNYIYFYTPATLTTYGVASSYTINQNNGEAHIEGNNTIGSVTSPINLQVNLTGTYKIPSGNTKTSELQLRNNVVIYGDLIVNGNLYISDNVKVYGNIIANGTVTTTDNVIINGAIISKGEVQMLGNTNVTGVVYSQTGKVRIENNAQINGAAVAGTDLYLRANGFINYQAAKAKITIHHYGASGSTGGYGKLAGSWTDS